MAVDLQRNYSTVPGAVDPGHAIYRPGYRSAPMVRRPRVNGSPYEQGETARHLQLRCQCLREQAYADPEGWFYLEAHIKGGRVLARGRWDEAETRYHVAMLEANGYAYPIAFATTGGYTEHVTSRELLTRLQDALLWDECHDALYHALWDAGMVNLAGTGRLYEELTDTAVDAVIASAWTPIQAADYVVKALVKDRRA